MQTDRQSVASSLLPVMNRSLLSISFSRGFGLTASQLGVVLVPQSHPICQQFGTQLNCSPTSIMLLAAQAFLEMDLEAAQQIDGVRARWVESWLEQNHLPVVRSGSYYVKAFRVEGALPSYFAPLVRDDIVRLCFKPPQS